MKTSEKFVLNIRAIAAIGFYVGLVFAIGRYISGSDGAENSVKLALVCALVYLFSEVTQSMRQKNEIDLLILQKQNGLEKQLMEANQKIGGNGLSEIGTFGKPVIVTFDENGNPIMPDGINDGLKSILSNLKIGPNAIGKSSRLEDLSMEALQTLHQKAIDAEDFERAAVIRDVITKKSNG